MRNYLIPILLILALSSCGKSDAVRPDLVSPSLTRDAMIFQSALQVFSGTVTQPSVDADNGEILNGPGTDANVVGTPWVDSSSNHWGFATAVKTSLAGAHCPYFKKLEVTALGNIGVVNPTEFELPLPQLLPPYLVTQVRLPRIAACYLVDTDGIFPPVPPFVEVAVAYQFLDPSNNDWEIAVVRSRFENPNNPPGFEFQTVTFGTPEIYQDDDHANTQPDIAYNPVNGDLYLISTTYVNSGTAHLFISKGVRHQDDYRLVTWDNPLLAQKDETFNPPQPHNSFHPRIDIGQVNFGSYTGDQWLVGIAYTGWSDLLLWHIRVNYWATTEDDEIDYIKNDVGWNDAIFPLFPAGIPNIDIGPPGSDHAAIVWMQAKSHEWANCTVMYADTHVGSISLGRLHPDPAWGSDCSAFPSVAVHQGQTPGGDYRSSISYLRTRNYISGWWAPQAVYADTGPGILGVNFGPATVIPSTTQAVGKWDAGATIEHYAGMSTALTVYQGSYWMLWSAYDPVTSGGPCSVYGAFGNTNP